MAQGFYSLAEAANLLGITPEALSQKAQNHEIRAFADKGSWRFKAEDIDASAKGDGGSEFDIGAPPVDGGSEFDLNPSASDSVVKVGQLPDSEVNVGAPSGGSNLFPQAPSGGGNLFGGGDSGGSSIFSSSPPSGGGNVFDASSEFELTMDQPAPAGQPDSGVLRLADEPPALTPTADLNLANISDAPDLGAPPAGTPAAGGSDVRLGLDSGSYEFDLKVDSGGRLNTGEPPSKARPTTDKPGGPPSGSKAGGEEEVRLDFDGATIDDSMLLVGEQRPDSDVRLEPVSMPRPPSSQVPYNENLMRTEEIDLDAELRKAEEASRLAKRVPGGPPASKTQLPGPSHATQLPDQPGASPFELSEEDLQLPQGSHRTGTGSSSEFELTLAGEEGELASPLNLGDDEDIDLGAAPSSQANLGPGRAELSGINLGRPADSGISLEKGASSDRVDFELTLDEDATGPRTMHGKAVDSDSEFELTIDDSAVMKSAPSEQLDIFEESQFESTAPSSTGSSDESGSQAVALDDTDLESSDFDLAIDDASQEFSTSGDESLSDDTRKTKVKGDKSSEFSDVDSMVDEDLVEPEPEAAAEEEEGPTIPAAQADWGVVPVMLLAPCVALMMIAGLMAYELLHGMWGYHQATPQGGILVTNLASLFSGDESKQ